MTRKLLLAWERGHVRANERSWELRAQSQVSSEESFDRANSLLRLMGDVITSPSNEEARRKETEAARAQWLKLRQKYAARSS